MNIEVTDAWQCDQTTQREVYSRPWYGMEISCDCTKKCAKNKDGYDMNWCYTMVQSQQCDENMRRLNC